MDEQLHATSLANIVEDVTTIAKYLVLSFPFIWITIKQQERRHTDIKECKAQKATSLRHLNAFAAWLEEMRLICGIEYISETSHVSTEVQTLIKHSIPKCLKYIEEIESVDVKKYLRYENKDPLIFSLQEKIDWVKDVKKKVKKRTRVHSKGSVVTK